MPSGHMKFTIPTLASFAIAFTIAFSITASGTNTSTTASGAEEWPVHDMKRPQPAMVNPGMTGTAKTPGTAPSDATVLLGAGTGLKHWNHGGWKVDADGIAQVTPGTGDIRTKESFGDCQFHIEWMVPGDRKTNGQAGGTSGVFFNNQYEVQILDAFQNTTYADGTAGSFYGQHPPLVNPCRPKGQWNVYDIIYTAPRWDEDGNLSSPARATVIFNGVVVQNNRAFWGSTAHGSKATYGSPHGKGPIRIQDHSDPIRFRNIWVRELDG